MSEPRSSLPLVVLAVVLAQGGTPQEADAVLSALLPQMIPQVPSEAHEQVAAALRQVRGAS